MFKPSFVKLCSLKFVLLCWIFIIQNVARAERDKGISHCVENSPCFYYHKEKEMHVKYGESFNLSCISPIKINGSDYPFADNLKTAQYDDEKQYYYKYSTLFHVKQATSVNVGEYKCAYYDENKVEQVASIYVFVHGSNDQMVPIMDHEDYSIDHDRVLFPCKPTTPDVTVDLYMLQGKHAEKVIVGKDTFTGRNITYDAKHGFELENPTIYDIGLRAYCTFTLDGKKNTSNEFTINAVHVPTITSENGGNLQTGSKSKLSCSVRTLEEAWFSLEWVNISANMKKNEKSIKEYVRMEDGSIQEYNYHINTLTIYNVNKDNSGNYTCVMVNLHTRKPTKAVTQITVRDVGEAFINISESNGAYRLEEDAGKYIQWKLIINAFPKPTITFFDHRNNKISWNSDKIENITISPTRLVFRINKLELSDAGVYRIQATNKYRTTSLNLTLVVRAAPNVTLISKEFVLMNTYSYISCTINGYPKPQLNWYFQPFGEMKKIIIPEGEYKLNYDKNGYTIRSHLTKYANESGVIHCVGVNQLGEDTASSCFYVSEIEEGFGIERHNDTITTGDNVTIVCIASIYKKFEGPVNWYHKDSVIPLSNEISPDYRVMDWSTLYSFKLYMRISNITKQHGGKYTCRAGDHNFKENGRLQQAVNIYVHDILPPKIEARNISNKIFNLYVGSPDQHFDCNVKGYPIPTVEWYKGDRKIKTDERIQTENVTQGNSRLRINVITEDDHGVYTCKAKSRAGNDNVSFTINIKNAEIKIFYITIICILMVVFVMMLICLIWKIIRERKIKEEFALTGLLHFEKGDTQCLNPELGVDEQAELLPYDKKWEFPREQLKLGLQLGSGAFGVVMKAKAHNIVEGEESTTVAVKMVKKTADATFIKALASELKIMVHLGKHLNVVNLLGACTNNVAKRELLVIVEYCRFGNIHNYLLRHRGNFINQVVPETDTIDITIGSDHINRAYSVSSNRSGNRMKIYLGELQTSYETGTVSPLLPNDNTYELNEIVSNGSAQPEWRSNYRGDYNYKRDVKPITTQDLVCWAFQVARGMKYLANRKVLHGDLAARNILLADDNIVKICDFGLAKSMYKNDNYKKKGDGPLPVKWMAIESIRDGIFSTQSDIWSYGVVLWEFFSLSKVPYAGLEIDDKFCEKLSNGYRLQKPDYATNSLYEIILDCWRADPLCRPTFGELADKLSHYLSSTLMNHIIELNETYTDMNLKWMNERGDNDYLAMMSAPDYGNMGPNTKHEYINHPFGGPTSINPMSPDDSDAEDYLPMKRPNADSITQKSLPVRLRPSTTREDFLNDDDNIIDNDFKLDPIQLERYDSGVGDSKPTTPTSLTSPFKNNSNYFSNPSYKYRFIKRNSNIDGNKNDKVIETK